MSSYLRKTLAVLSTGAFLVVGTAGAANAARPIQVQDGLVNVAIGDVTILEDVNVGIAAAVAANICGVSVGPVAVLGLAVDRGGDTETVCESAAGPVEIEQN